MSRSLAWLRRGALPRHRLTLRDLQGGLQGGGVRGGKLEGGVEDSVQGRVGSLLLCPPSRRLHLSRASGCIKSNVPDEEKEKSEVITQGYFDRREEERNKESFEGAVDIFTHKDSRRRGQVEFIYAAMRNMEKFGVHKDLASYKKLLEVFPKGKMIPENRLQADFFHYPKQQQCATSLLQKMESNKIIPDEETGDLLLNVFGKYSTPYKRYCRMMYWMPKFKNLSPWPLPEEMPREGLELARLAIRQITSVDPATRIEVIDTQDIPDSNDKVSYFILRGPPRPSAPPPALDEDSLGNLARWMDGEAAPGGTVAREPGVHEQEDGTILAVCATGTSSRDSLLSWVRRLEAANPSLQDMVVLFTVTSPLGPVVPVQEHRDMARPPH